MPTTDSETVTAAAEADVRHVPTVRGGNTFTHHMTLPTKPLLLDPFAGMEEEEHKDWTKITRNSYNWLNQIFHPREFLHQSQWDDI